MTIDRDKPVKIPNFTEEQLIIIRLLGEEGRLSRNELILKSKQPSKIVGYAIRRLMKWNIITKVANLKDMRSGDYILKNPDYLKYVREEFIPVVGSSLKGIKGSLLDK